MPTMPLVRIAEDLRRSVAELRFGDPVSQVYDPLDYAWAPHRLYLERFGSGQPEAVLVGMNPGPWGMAQTGVPFGDVPMVRDWMGIEAPVSKPPREHPKRPVQGFHCHRREASGQRLWGWARDRFGKPERFFARFFVLNYCPLCFMEDSGRNRTPDKLTKSEQESLFAACDRALARSVKQLRPRYVIGIGRFAERRAAAALAGMDVTLGHVPHPSPANPQANRGWAKQMEAMLHGMGIAL